MTVEKFHNSSDDGIDMKSDIVNRLDEAGSVGSLCWEAAAEIERLRDSVAEIDKLRQRISELEDRVSDLEARRD